MADPKKDKMGPLAAQRNQGKTVRGLLFHGGHIIDVERFYGLLELPLLSCPTGTGYASTVWTNMEPLGLVLLRTDHPILSRCVGASRDLRRGATDAQRSEFGVGTPVWTISHPDGKRAYYSEGVITEWLPSSLRFKHSIPTMPGSAGMGFELLYGRCVWD